MIITKKIIITDTNIVTDLNNANLLNEFIKLDNVYVCDIIKYDEINYNTCNANIISKIKIIKANEKEISEAMNVTKNNPKLSYYDSINYIIAKNNKCILATGDKRLKKFSKKNGVEVIRTLKIIKLLYENNIITKSKTIEGCNLLKICLNTRIPRYEIDSLINEIDLITNKKY